MDSDDGTRGITGFDGVFLTGRFFRHLPAVVDVTGDISSTPSSAISSSLHAEVRFLVAATVTPDVLGLTSSSVSVL